jgi:hypothetical protein
VETGKVHQPLPINSEALDGRWRQLAVAPGKLCPQLLACRLALGIGHGTEERTRLGLLFFRDRIQDVGDPMVPAPLRGRGKLQFAERRPDAKGGRLQSYSFVEGLQVMKALWTESNV